MLVCVTLPRGGVRVGRRPDEKARLVAASSIARIEHGQFYPGQLDPGQNCSSRFGSRRPQSDDDPEPKQWLLTLPIVGTSRFPSPRLERARLPLWGTGLRVAGWDAEGPYEADSRHLAVDGPLSIPG